MGLFDHLFKAKSPSGDEKVGEHALEGNAVAKQAEGAPRTPTPQRADPSAFLHPKNSVPRGAPGLTPAPRPSSAVSGKSSERRPPPAGSPPASDEIVLTLGDVLSRIPSHYLKTGAHDAKRELRFKINDLSSDIARGRAAVPLSRIAKLAPEIFVKGISRDEDTEVRLPLQKLVEQIGLLRSQPKTSGVEKIARPVTSVELPPMEVRKAEPIAVPSVMEPIFHGAGHPQTPPIILAEPAMLQKGVELKPAASPVILGPPPVIDSPAVMVASVTPVPPGPEITPPIAEVQQPVEPAAPVSEPSSVIPPPPPAAPPAVLEPQAIVIDWGGDSPAQGDAGGESGTRDMVAEPRRFEPAAEAPRLAPVESPQLDPGEESIQLSLAAILRNCPPEIIIKRLPHVDDSVRITLPFAPIDRQLIKGQVEVSALRFVAALPEVYQKYFVAKVGVKVPIPLEEVFQNLPTPTHTLTPVRPVPPPVVLAPAAPAVAVASAAALPEDREEELPIPPVPSEPPEIATQTVSAMTPPPLPPQPEPPASEVATDIGIEPPADDATAPEESQPEVPPVDLAPPPSPVTPAAESAAAASAEPSQVPFRPPLFRPHFLPPPPIFGFTSASAASESESAAPSAPPTVLAGFTEAETGAAPALETPASSGRFELPPPPDATAWQPQNAETSPEEGSDAEPSADLIALATEHSAPDLVQFSSEPVPYADLTETLAHETTYAHDLAEVVHGDMPDAESGEPHAHDTVEQPQTPVGEYTPLHFHEPAPGVEQPDSREDAAEPTEIPAAEMPAVEEPVASEQTAPPAESGTELETAASAVETPDALASEAPAFAVPPPLPYPLFSLPKLHVEPSHGGPSHIERSDGEHSHVEVLPPALPLRRFDQDAVQALFMTEETLDLPKISRLAAGLPGVYACVIATRDQACTGGTLPEGFDLAALLGLAPRVGEAASRMPIGQLKHFTLYGDAYSVSFFERHGLSLCAVHRPRSFVPGVREKLVALADELSR